MNIWTALGIGLIAFTVAAGFIRVSEADWVSTYRTFIPVLLGLGLGGGIGLVLIGRLGLAD